MLLSDEFVAHAYQQAVVGDVVLCLDVLLEGDAYFGSSGGKEVVVEIVVDAEQATESQPPVEGRFAFIVGGWGWLASGFDGAVDVVFPV